MKPTELVSYPIEEVSLYKNFRKAKNIDPAKIDEMAESILEHGIIQPPPAILLEGKPHVTMGQRRYYGFLRAAKMVEERGLIILPWSDLTAAEAMSSMPLLISDIDERTVMLQQMVENLQREDVSLRDEADGYAYLQQEHEMTLAQIAQRIGKSTQRVSACIKLRNVPEEMWTAYEEKKLSSEHLVLVGRVPHEKDRKALAKKVLTPKYNGLLMTREETKDFIRSDYMMALRGCPWKLEDVSLVPAEYENGEPGAKLLKGGPCTTCPHRSGNDPDLAAEIQADKGGSGSKAGIDANLCLNPQCYREKREAAWKLKRAEAEAKGMKVLSDAEAADLFETWGRLKTSTGLVDLSDEPDYYATGAHGEATVLEDKTWEKLVPKKVADKELKLCRHPKTKEVIRLIDRETVIRLAEAAMPEGTKSPFANRPKPKVAVSAQEDKASKEAERRQKEHASKVQTAYERMLWDGLSEGLRMKPITETMLKGAVRQAYALGAYDDSRLIFQICGLDPESRINDEADWAEVERCIMKTLDKSDKTASYLRWVLLFLTVAEVQLAYGEKVSEVDGVAGLLKALRIDPSKLEAKADAAVKAAEKDVAREDAAAKRRGRLGLAGTGESGAALSEIEKAEAGETVFDADAELRARCREYREEHPKCSIGDLVKEFMIDRETATAIFDGLVDQAFDDAEKAERLSKLIGGDDDWQAQWDALPSKPKKSDPEALKRWNAARMRIKRGAQKAGVVLE